MLRRKTDNSKVRKQSTTLQQTLFPRASIQCLKLVTKALASEYIEIGLLVCEKKMAVLVFLLLSVITLYHLSPFHLET